MSLTLKQKTLGVKSGGFYLSDKAFYHRMNFIESITFLLLLTTPYPSLDPPEFEFPSMVSKICSSTILLTNPILFFNDTSTTEIYTLSLPAALPSQTPRV